MTQTPKTEQIFREFAAISLEVGDILYSSSGKKMKVTAINKTNNRVNVLLDGDMEIDFKEQVRINKVGRYQ